MRNSAIRVAMWAGAGFVVAVGWGLYFASADKATPIGSMVYTLAYLTTPVAGVVSALYPDFPLGLRTVVAANVVTYAILASIAEQLRSRYRSLRNSN